MKQIIVCYYHQQKYPDLEFSHGEQFKYNRRKRNQIIDYVLDSNYNVMLLDSTDVLIIYIDKGNFKQK